MGWTAGYASDIEYVTGFYREQSPNWLNLVCLLNGVQPVPLDQPYTYCELGFGRGLTAKLLAASNPVGQFYAADFNPAHVAGAGALAREARLPNLTLLENSFEQLADGEVALPQFDFITLHGIYTWVTAENRRHIVRFISRYLKPGGLVYVSYNAMPGWAPSLPLQRLLVEYADAFPNRSDLQLKGATEFVTQLEEAKAGYLQQNPGLKARTASWKTSNPNYLVHEYLHKHWQPLFHADVARDLAEAKMSYAGPAELHGAYPAIFLNGAQRQLVDRMPHAEMRETIKDYMLNTSFRKDVFVHGAVRLSPLRQAELMAQMGVLLTVPRAAASLAMKLSNGEVNGAAQLYTPVLDALAQRPHTLAELSRLPALAGQNMQSVAQIAALLTAANQAAMYFPATADADGEAARRLNRTLAAQARYSDEHQALSSPLLGSGIPANYVERLFYLALQQAPEDVTPGTLARSAWQVMAPLGRRLQREGVVLESADDNLAELSRNAHDFIADKLPLWRTLRLL
jgi:SAM-dependent methyltransferase